jgi:hypothetical protein
MTHHTRNIDNTIYSRKAFAASREAYGPYCSASATPRADGLVAITISVREQHIPETRRIVLEFWNFFLDSATNERVEAE